MPELLKSHDKMANNIAIALVKFRANPRDMFTVNFNPNILRFSCVNETDINIRSHKRPRKTDRASGDGEYCKKVPIENYSPFYFIEQCKDAWNEHKSNEWPLTNEIVMRKYIHLLIAKGIICF